MRSLRSPINSADITVMTRALEKVVRGVVRDFGELESLQVSRKGLKSFVSSADIKIEKTLHEELSKARPDFGFIMEEQGVIEGKDTTSNWIIDPLDGTHNFIHGIPHFAISIALEKKGEIVAGVTYDPIKDELFSAEKGAGAFMNDKRIRTSGRRDLLECFFNAPPSFYFNDDKKDVAKQITKSFLSFRHTGAATLDLAYLAAGRFDALWKHDAHIWDVAVGSLLVREAGGFITDLKGGEFKVAKTTEILAANQHIHSSVLGHVKNYYKK